MSYDDLFAGTKLGAYVILSDTNRTYLTGLKTSFGCVIITPTDKFFITDFRYEFAARDKLTDYEIIIIAGSDLYTEVAKVLHKREIKVAAFEGTITYGEYAKLKSALSGISLKDGYDAIMRRRIIKTPEEISYIAKAQEIAQNALTKTLKSIRAGVSERDIHAELVYNMLDCGAEKESFPSIIAFGGNAAKPHHHPSDRKLEKGELILMDFGACYNGYCSDMTRTFGLGTLPKDCVKMYNDVLGAQEYALKNIRAGITAHEADSFAREFLLSRGFGAEFGHSTGHGVGIDIHEPPRLGTNSEMILEEGMVVTVEPGVYVRDVGGVRIEDMVVVTKDGIKNLTTFPKELYL